MAVAAACANNTHSRSLTTALGTKHIKQKSMGAFDTRFCNAPTAPTATQVLKRDLGPRRLDAAFLEPFDRDHQMLQLDPRQHHYLACALLGRGAMSISDVNRAIARLKPCVHRYFLDTVSIPHCNSMLWRRLTASAHVCSIGDVFSSAWLSQALKLVDWNPDGFKVGLCDVPPVGAPHSVLCLANNTAIVSTFEQLRLRFSKLYARKAHIHHYTEYMEEAIFDEAIEHLAGLSDEYTKLEGYRGPAHPPRAQPVV
eukprot:SAG11_NODE_2089_length_3844_cov_3.009880_5_plen_255_part_00